MIPHSADLWTLDIIKRLVEQGIFETDRFDFKAILPPAKDDSGKRRLRRDVAAFANSEGGFLIYGVKDDKALSPVERIIGLPGSFDFPEQFGSFPSACEPAIEWTFKNNPPISLPGKRVIHVVQIDSSRRKPHGVFEDDRWWFTKRTNKGTEFLSYEEMRNAFLDTGRRQVDLAWLKAEVLRIFKSAQMLNIEAGNDRWHDDMFFARFSSEQLRALRFSVFADLRRSSILITELDSLIDFCSKADTLLAQLSPFAFRAQDPAYDLGGALDSISRSFFQITLIADRVVKELDRLGIGN